MTHLGTLLSALLLLVLTVAEPLNSPEENEVLKHTEVELIKSQASDRGNPPCCYRDSAVQFSMLEMSLLGMMASVKLNLLYFTLRLLRMPSEISAKPHRAKHLPHVSF